MSDNFDLMKTVEVLLSKCTYTQDQLAFYFNVDRSLISKWKNGTRVMNANQFERLCDLMGVSISDLENIDNIPDIDINYRGYLTNEDLNQIAKINRIILNLRMMEDLLSETKI